MNNENDNNLQVNYIQNQSIDSIDDDFQPTWKYINFNSNTNKIGVINTKVNLTKKDTKMSSNVEEENESLNNNNNINENISSNILDIHSPLSDNHISDRKTRNNNTEEKLHSPKGMLSMSNNNISSFEAYDNNYPKKITLTEVNENKKIKEEEILRLKISEESISSNEKKKKRKLNEISKKKKRKKIIFLEEKKKYQTSKKSIFNGDEKEEKKEDEKFLRKDKNGVPICKKNKKKVKISFERPFEIVTPIESYKEYNLLVDLPKYTNLLGNNYCECQCCSLF